LWERYVAVRNAIGIAILDVYFVEEIVQFRGEFSSIERREDGCAFSFFGLIAHFFM
jgi:hypothetical protein